MPPRTKNASWLPVEDVSASSSSSSSSSEERMTEPMQPRKFLFEASEFDKYPKIGTRCDPYTVVDYIKKLGPGLELQWFLEHRQFRYFFHMHLHTNRKLMGLWSLLVRMVETDKKKEMWFVINGIPIRYSIREHGLISGLDCGPYPKDYENLGGTKFVTKYFGEGAKPWPEHIYKKLVSMKDSSRDRLRMCVLWFLAAVIKGKTKVQGSIDPFLIRIVDKLELCKTFPWGRLTFDDALQNFPSILSRMRGVVKPSTTIPEFILPLEVIC